LIFYRDIKENSTEIITRVVSGTYERMQKGVIHTHGIISLVTFFDLI